MSNGRVVKVRKAFTSSLLAEILGAVFGFVGIAIFTRVFSVSEIGTIYAVVAGSLSLTALSRGVFTSAKKRISEVDTENGQFVAIAILFHLCFSILAAIPIAVAAVLEPFGIPRHLYIYAYLLMLSVGLFDALTDTYAGAGFPDRATWLDTFRTIAGVAAQLTLIWLNIGLQSIIAGQVIGAVIAAVLAFYLHRPAVTWPDRAAVSSAIAFAKWDSTNEVVGEVTGRATIAIAGALLGGSAAGQYKTVRALAVPLLFFSSSLASPLSVRVSAEDSAGGEASESIQFALVAVGIFSIPAFVGALIIGNSLVVAAFGEQYTGNGLLLAILLLGTIAQGVDNVLDSLLFGFDKPHLSTKAEVVYAAVLSVLLILGSLRFGILGFVIAIAAGRWFLMLLKAGLLYRVNSSVLSFPTAVLSEIGAATAMGLILFGITMVLPSKTGTLTTVMLVAVGGISYAVALLLISGRVRRLLQETRDEIIQ